MTAGRRQATKSQDWGTPQKYVDIVRAFFGGDIDLDPCSNRHSIVRAKIEYSLPEQNGLCNDWCHYRNIYVNPPYGRDKIRGTSIADWLKKCDRTHKTAFSEILALVPVATNTKHWKQHVFGSAMAVSFLHDTRLKFLINGKEEGKGAPMACAIVYWGIAFGRFYKYFGPPIGAVADLRALKEKREYNDKVCV